MHNTFNRLFLHYKSQVEKREREKISLIQQLRISIVLKDFFAPRENERFDHLVHKCGS